MSRKFLTSATGSAIAVVLISAAPALAQGYGHGGHLGFRHHHGVHHHAPQVCYETVKTEDVFANVRRRVLVAEGRWETKEVPEVTKVVDRQVLVTPGRWEVKVTPAVTETRERQVLVEPARTIWHVTPPVFKTERVSKPVEAGHGHHHGHGHGHHGKQNAVLSYDRKVLVEPAKRHAEVKPAVYKTEKFEVIVQPAKHERIWHPPVFETKKETVVVQAATQQKIYHPPQFDWKEERVLVKKGGTFQRPVYKAHGEKC